LLHITGIAKPFAKYDIRDDDEEENPDII